MLVEDDRELSELISDYLTKNDFNISCIANGVEAIDGIIKNQPDLVILDIMLPGCSGMDVCKAVRPNYAGPILMLTAIDDDIDQMLGLELGADDYVIKPIHPRLLLSRIKALLRRVNGPNTINHKKIIVGQIVINTATRAVTVNDKTCELTSAEYELLLLLAQDVGSVVERNTIVNELRGFDYDGLDRSVDRRISRLRKKLQHMQKGSNGKEMIKTIRGKGYQLCVEEEI